MFRAVGNLSAFEFPVLDEVFFPTLLAKEITGQGNVNLSKTVFAPHVDVIPIDNLEFRTSVPRTWKFQSKCSFNSHSFAGKHFLYFF